MTKIIAEFSCLGKISFDNYVIRNESICPHLNLSHIPINNKWKANTQLSPPLLHCSVSLSSSAVSGYSSSDMPMFNHSERERERVWFSLISVWLKFTLFSSGCRFRCTSCPDCFTTIIVTCTLTWRNRRSVPACTPRPGFLLFSPLSSRSALLPVYLVNFTSYLSTHRAIVYASCGYCKPES